MRDLYPKSFGKYLLTKRVAVGGMAEVFKAKLLGAKGFEKTLAVKRILPEYSQDEEFVQMFVDEARISSNLHHKNIVQVFEFGEVNQQYYLTMEFIDGSNLKNLFFRSLKLNRPFPKDLVYFIILKIASALDYAHKVKMEDHEESLQLVHRDVSPQNILISKMGDVKITDFGIAKAAIKLSQTQPGKIQGKYSYMSPEQALGKNITFQSDIFSLGIVFYELLTAKKVYGSSETLKRYSEATRANIPRIGTVISDLPSQIDTLITRMVAKNPEDRPKDCTEIIDTLMEFLASSSDEVLSAKLGAMVLELFPEEMSKPSRESSGSGSVKDHIQISRRSSLPEVIQSVITQKDESILVAKWHKRLGVVVILVALAFLFPWVKGRFHSQHQETVQQTKPEVPPDETEEKPIPNEAKNHIAEMENEISQLDDEIEIAQAELAKNTSMEKPKDVEPVQTETPAEQTPVKVPPPIKGCSDNMVLIEGGDFMMGSNDPERNSLVENTAQKKYVQKFCVDRFEYPNKRNATTLQNVSWFDARDACEKQRKRLCTEIEWERACKGPSSLTLNQQYPYGSTWKPNACNIKNFNSLTDEESSQQAADSGDYPECATSEGVFDLIGNVQEWTASDGLMAAGKKVIKGGSYLTPKFQSRCSSFREESSDSKQDDIGFRCCKDAL